jgi:hypothetical protein
MEVAMPLNRLREPSAGAATDAVDAGAFTAFLQAFSEPILRGSFADQAPISMP